MLNDIYPRFCSAFPDTDAAFGSVGSFFEVKFEEGSYELNPPFVPALITRLVDRCEQQLAAAEAAGKALAFFIVVGANARARKHPAWGALGESRFCRAKLLVPLKEHG